MPARHSRLLSARSGRSKLPTKPGRLIAVFRNPLKPTQSWIGRMFVYGQRRIRRYSHSEYGVAIWYPSETGESAVGHRLTIVYRAISAHRRRERILSQQTEPTHALVNIFSKRLNELGLIASWITIFMANRKPERLQHCRNYVCNFVFTHQTFESLSAPSILVAKNYELSRKDKKLPIRVEQCWNNDPSLTND